jgi:hypothetical protein
MKQMTCVEMGGPATCSAMISGNTPDEMVGNGMKHLAEAHPKMVEDMKTMPKEVGDKWRAEFQEKWDAAPEM